MKRNTKLVIGLDVDDVLFECIRPAVEIANRRYGYTLKFEDIVSWGFTTQTEEQRKHLFDIMSEKDFFTTQTPIEGSVRLVEQLIEKEHDVVIISATSPSMMSYRSHMLRKHFPMIPEKNIMLGARKDLVKVDVLLDDAPHNIKMSGAKYPVLFRKPWNAGMTGFLSVNSYDEFLTLVDMLAACTIEGSDLGREEGKVPKVVCLVGPSGSGKTAIAKELEKNPAYAIVRSTTTRKKRPGESDDAYNFISREKFFQLQAEGKFLETTAYAESFYGTQRSDITRILNKGKNAVIPIDICGATAMRNAFGSRAVLVFVRRSKEEILLELVSRTVSPEDKVHRIVSLESEFANEDLCDFTVNNRTTIEEAAKQIIEHLT